MFTQDHLAFGLELKCSDSKLSTLSSGISVWLLRQIQSFQNKTRENECHRAFSDGRNYSEQEGRMYMEEIIYWFSRMEGNSVLSLKKVNEQVEISLWGKRSKRVGDGPFVD